MDNYESLNEILVHLFNHTLEIEENYLTKEPFTDISVNDMHIIEAIGPETSSNMSTIAKKVGVTIGTLTIAINSLVRKEYVIRVRSTQDRRVVLISLSDKGKAAFARHKNFHQHMAEAMRSSLTQEECQVLVKGLSSLKQYFNNL